MAGRAIDKLRKAANLKSSRRLVVLENGDEFEFWSTPLTMAQREKANRDAKSDDINQFALQLLLTKATDESGGKLFSPGDLAVLKNEVRDDDLQKLMLAVIQTPEDEEEDLDLMLTSEGAPATLQTLPDSADSYALDSLDLFRVSLSSNAGRSLAS